MKIYKSTETKLETSEIVSIMHLVGEQLPDPLCERVNIFDYTQKLLKNGSIYIVFNTQDNPVGIMGFYANNQITKVAYLTIIGLLPEARGKGIGNKLMKFLFTESHRLGMKKISLNVNQSNRQAIKLYKQQGFKVKSHDKVKFEMIKTIQFDKQ